MSNEIDELQKTMDAVLCQLKTVCVRQECLTDLVFLLCSQTLSEDAEKDAKKRYCTQLEDSLNEAIKELEELVYNSRAAADCFLANQDYIHYVKGLYNEDE